MNENVKVGLGVGGAYLLGRRKKMKLAVGLGTWLLGKRIKLDPQALLVEGLQKLAENPDVMKLSDEVRGQLFQAARTAAAKGLADQLNTLTETLNKQTELVSAGAAEGRKAVEDTGEAVGGAVGDTVEGAGDAVGETAGAVGDTVHGVTGGGDEDSERQDESDQTAESDEPEQTDEDPGGLETRGRRRSGTSNGSNGNGSRSNGSAKRPARSRVEAQSTKAQKPSRERAGSSSRSAASGDDAPRRTRRTARPSGSASSAGSEERPRRSRRPAAAQS